MHDKIISMTGNNNKTEHILVCISSSPSNPKVITAASEMAKVYNALFTALYIETSKTLTEDNKKRLYDNTRLAKQNGAKIVTVNGDDIPFQVSQYAKASRATKIIIGRSGYKPSRFFTPPNFIDKLIGLTPDIEIYVIPDKAQKLYIGQKHNEQFKLPKMSLKDALKSITVLIAVTLISSIFRMLNIDEANIIMIYILAVVLIAYITDSKIFSIVSSLLSVMIFNFFFIIPYHSLEVYGSEYSVTFVIMFLVALFASIIAKKFKEQAELSSLKAYRTEVMLEMSQKLQQFGMKNEINEVTREQLKKLLNCNVDLFTNKNDDEIVNWVFDNNQQAGNTTENFSQSVNFYLPISNVNKVFAVVKIEKNEISEFEKSLLIAMLRESALAYEKDAISQLKNELMIKNNQEELRSTLLRAISHDLRTPLTGISGYAELLLKNSSKITDNKKQEIYTDIYDDSIWLLNLVENLLSITRFDRNEITLKKESESVSDVISEALSHLGRKKDDFIIKTKIEDETLCAKMDGKLISQVIFNLVDNAMKYSPCNTTVTVGAKAVTDYIEISVEDEGNGIKDEDKEKIFDMFYTVNNSITDGRRGLGLGLALCKAVVEAHGGEIEIKDNSPKGTIFSFKLKGEANE
ncbi:putative uncharacterized protein [Clostridium sp. CAG:729]|nr:putative uncharacterized protein [Clostridium sp. CAG:729]